MGVLGAKGSWPHPNLLTFGLASYTPRRRGQGIVSEGTICARAGAWRGGGGDVAWRVQSPLNPIWPSGYVRVIMGHLSIIAASI